MMKKIFLGLTAASVAIAPMAALATSAPRHRGYPTHRPAV